MTARELIRRAMMLIGVLGTGETPEASEAQDALLTLNEMLESWSNQPYAIYHWTIEPFELTSGKLMHTIGPLGDFDTVRPLQIERAFIKLSGQDYELEILSPNEYASISIKDQTGQPTKIYISGTHPTDSIYLWPVPDQNYTLNLHSLKPLMNLPTLTTEIQMPPGYVKALRYNLALELAPEYGKEPSGIVLREAVAAKSLLMDQNKKPLYIRADEATLEASHFNIIAGSFRT